jgi:hypothetical protein
MGMAAVEFIKSETVVVIGVKILMCLSVSH